jgi:hypothetical protein
LLFSSIPMMGFPSVCISSMPAGALNYTNPGYMKARLTL